MKFVIVSCLACAQYAHAFPHEEVLDLISFFRPASSASIAMTSLALNAGSKKAAEWFYLSSMSKSLAVHSIRDFEDKTRISFSESKAPFFCSTIMYLQGAAVAMQREAASQVATEAAIFNTESASSTVNSLLSAYAAASNYAGYCILMFPSPDWKEGAPPCEGMSSFPEDSSVDGVALFSLKCLAATDFDWRTVSPGYRPGGVSAMMGKYASVVPLSDQPTCAKMRTSHMAVRIVGMAVQSLFTQLMAAPVSAMLMMEVKSICTPGFEDCMRFENVAAVFFESFSSSHDMVSSIGADVMCLLARADTDPFAEFVGTSTD